MTWFLDLTGFHETTAEAARAQLSHDGETLTSHANGRQFHAGPFEMASLQQLRERTAELGDAKPVRLQEIVADAGALHAAPASAGALFQAASQFNMLEMVGQHVTPEAGIAGYEHDRTQGPACAIACGAGTIVRQYFVPCGGGLGQTEERQLDGLADIGRVLGNDAHGYWTMSNGYALANTSGLMALNPVLTGMSGAERDALGARLRLGVQWSTEVTREAAGHRVAQVYGSALPIGYCTAPTELWEPFARLVLDASYEGTLHAARVNAEVTGNRDVFLTLIGGGVFANPVEWILDAIDRALGVRAASGLNVHIVSYGRSNPLIADRLGAWMQAP